MRLSSWYLYIIFGTTPFSMCSHKYKLNFKTNVKFDFFSGFRIRVRKTLFSKMSRYKRNHTRGKREDPGRKNPQQIDHGRLFMVFGINS
jgi:hypothetical protein